MHFVICVEFHADKKVLNPIWKEVDGVDFFLVGFEFLWRVSEGSNFSWFNGMIIRLYVIRDESWKLIGKIFVEAYIVW